ncbi:MAG: PSD1 and planctomycete cytochrome C domain-containing protein [Cyclobacteriaceae bacterium]
MTENMEERIMGRSEIALWVSVPLFLLLCLITVQCDQKTTSLKLPKKVDFNYDVKPILVQNCYLCHGPDPSSRKGELRLDTYEGATALRENGQAIDPGKPGRSVLIKRITHEDPSMMMPPPESNLKLSEYDIAVLTKWIDQGAEWKPHWSFIQPEAIKPKAFDKTVSANEIDDYIIEKLENKGLELAPRAEKNTLIRRVSYLLTGLPPTPEMVSKFESDESPDDYEKMVDHYLNSPGFGERWARHWMDLVRYAETKGHEFDYEVAGTWKYRDYLIRAFNEDVPYNQLVKEHIAGDLLDSVRWNKENGINESQIGTAFYAMGEGTHSPVDIRKDEADRIDNMIDVTTKTFQALTVSCAKCHDHKFDPIPTADYYALYGVMESSRFTPKSSQVTYEKLQNLDKLSEIKNNIKALVANQWKQEIDKEPVLNDTSESTNAVNTNDIQFIGDFRGAGLDGWKSDGFAFGKATTLGEVLFDEKGETVRGLDEGKASSKYFSTGIFGVLRSPNFTISNNFIGIRARGMEASIRIIIDNFQLIRNPIYGGLEKKVNSDEWQDVVFDLSDWKGHKAYIEIYPGGNRGGMVDYRLPKTAYVDVEYAIVYDDQWPEEIPEKNPNSTDRTNLIDRWLAREITSEDVILLNTLLKENKLPSSFPEAQEQLKNYEEIAQQVGDSTFFTGIDEGFGVDSHVFVRGNHNSLSDEEVPRGFLSAVSADNKPITKGSGRMEVAEAILATDNPLTARVMVNRIWHHLFGRGIVETVDNFGLQGKLPTHPELLDYLAIKFQEDGWSIKQMIKYIVMSNAFQRSVIRNGDAASKDPDNLYLSHFPLRRLEAEAIRDGLLFAGGNLDRTMYGPPEAVHLTKFMTGRGRPKESGSIDGNGRRTIYLEVRRNFLQPMMLTFDRPIPFTTFGKRNETNVPAQSLILMNDPFVKHQAELLAKRVLEEADETFEDRVTFVYQHTLSRPPTPEELESTATIIEQLALTHEVDDNDKAINDLMVWKDFCHSIFNLKEFIYLI